MAEHAPGPWEASGNRGYGNLNGVSVRDGRGYVLAVAIGDVPELDSAANARLIAAAPDLLMAAKRVSTVSDAVWVKMTDAEAGTLKGAFEALDAAIAKAEGRS